jgi:hypothetical protein
LDRILFLNVGWMSKYQGLQADKITGGGKYVSLHGYGHEIFNFKPYAGHVYGFARAPHGSIKLERLGGAKGAASVDGVLVIWVAKSLVVGWYENATVFRHTQPPPKESGRTYRGDPIAYNVIAKRVNSQLLDRDARLLQIPRAKEREHGMGRYSWYADGPTNRAFRDKVFEYVASGGDSSVLGTQRRKNKTGSTHGGLPHKTDPHKREWVEHYAINLTSHHFETLGYEVDSVEADNVGWDLNAVHRTTRLLLRVEVKGLSGHGVNVEMTRQEYEMMRKYKSSYRVCVATDSLDRKLRALSVFAYNDMSGKWTDGDDRPLLIQEVKSARLRAHPKD